jgi:uncharacterized protein YndB with AHSA1/START domain
MTGPISCQYTAFIAATPDEVWQALTDPELSAAWWAHRNVSDWQPGSVWEHRRLDGSAADIAGIVLAADPPARLALRTRWPQAGPPCCRTSRRSWKPATRSPRPPGTCSPASSATSYFFYAPSPPGRARQRSGRPGHGRHRGPGSARTITGISHKSLVIGGLVYSLAGGNGRHAKEILAASRMAALA